jgi:uncharacterized RDD family membrane protein YckC
LVIEERIAPTGKRIVSFVIDDVAVASLFIAIFFEQIALLKDPESVRVFLQLNLWVLVMLKILYHAFFVAYNGMTLGKYLVGLRVVSRESGELLSYSRALLRASVRIPDELFFYVGFLPAFFSPLQQTLHDQVSGCVVVHA